MQATANVSASRVEECAVVEGGVQKAHASDGSKTISGYHVYQTLGEGGFAKVKLCKHVESGEVFAMKIFRKGRLRRQRQYLGNGEGTGMKVQSALDKVYNEIRLLKRLHHVHCVRLHAVFDDGEQEGKLYIVIDYAAHGPTMEWDSQKQSYYVPATSGLVTEPQARAYVRDAALALAYIHDLFIAHRDVKPQNLLVCADGRTILSDFGVAIALGEDGMVEDTQGTFNFYAPEMCISNYRGHEARRVDIWALGITTWAFLFGTVPFYTADLASLFAKIATGQFTLPDCPVISSPAAGILTRMLDSVPEQRPRAAELLLDPWCADLP